MWRRPCWNIGSITCKLSEFVERSTRRHVNISCVQETKWKGWKAKEVEWWTMSYTGTIAIRNRNRVGVLVHKRLKNSVVDVRRQKIGLS